MLLKLVQGRSDGMDHRVVSLRGNGTIGPQLVSAGAHVVALGWRGGQIPGVRSIKSLIDTLREQRPDVIQGWMYHGNLAAAFVRMMAVRSAPLLWSIRCSFAAPSHDKLLTRVVIELGKSLSSRPDCTIYNSSRSRAQHIAAGYSPGGATVIPNGFDLKRFRPDPLRRGNARRRLCITDEEIVVGHIARVHPMKDQLTLVRAATLLVDKFPKLRMVAAGRDVDRLAQRVPDAQGPIAKLGNRLILLPEQEDVSELVQAFDVFVLSSAWGEGFPNVIGEAMACGVPCIATDTGDCGEIIAETGLVTTPGSPDQLASALSAVLSMSAADRFDLGNKARRRVEEHYSLESVVRKYESVWRTVTPREQGAFAR